MENVDTTTKLGLRSMDFSKWLSNTLDFFAPVGLIYLAYVGTQVVTNGFALTDFIPSNFVSGSMVLYVINVVMDFLRKRAKVNA